MKMHFAIGLMFFIPSLSPAVSLTGTVYEKDSNRQKVLYEWMRKETPDGKDLRVKIAFTDPGGQVTVTEEALLEANRIKRYSLEQRQTGESGAMEVRGNKILFSYTRKGQTKTSEEDLTDNLVAGPNLVDYLSAHRETLLGGGELPVRFAVLDRRETVGFKFFKVSEGTYNGKPTFVVKMKPTSFVIAAIVDPLFFTFQKDGMKLVELVGRTSPKRQVDGKWKDLDADILYHW